MGGAGVCVCGASLQSLGFHLLTLFSVQRLPLASAKPDTPSLVLSAFSLWRINIPVFSWCGIWGSNCSLGRLSANLRKHFLQLNSRASLGLWGSLQGASYLYLLMQPTHMDRLLPLSPAGLGHCSTSLSLALTIWLVFLICCHCLSVSHCPGVFVPVSIFHDFLSGRRKGRDQEINTYTSLEVQIRSPH